MNRNLIRGPEIGTEDLNPKMLRLYFQEVANTSSIPIIRKTFLLQELGTRSQQSEKKPEWLSEYAWG